MGSDEFHSFQIRVQIADEFAQERIIPLEPMSANDVPYDIVSGGGKVQMRIMHLAFHFLFDRYTQSQCELLTLTDKKNRRKKYTTLNCWTSSSATCWIGVSIDWRLHPNLRNSCWIKTRCAFHEGPSLNTMPLPQSWKCLAGLHLKDCTPTLYLYWTRYNRFP